MRVPRTRAPSLATLQNAAPSSPEPCASGKIDLLLCVQAGAKEAGKQAGDLAERGAGAGADMTEQAGHVRSSLIGPCSFIPSSAH